jgi:transcriptional regulator with XRE-family HTH domain
MPLDSLHEKAPARIVRRGEGPDPVDIHVGERIRLARNARALAQADLGVEIGVSFQQLQKYENAANRVSASRLFHLSRALDVPISYFFDGIDGQGETADIDAEGIAMVRFGFELIRHANKLPMNQRVLLLDLVRAMASGGEADCSEER